ncbi:MAG: hypothetical protein KGJ54_11880 [Betaproteobacteria bacterium]|nr:hypothetical protein [Betaproteobacteria bacterium]
MRLAKQLGCLTVADQVDQIDQPDLVDVARELGLDWLQGDHADQPPP